MIVSFQSEELHDCCCIADVAEKKLGSEHAQALATVIADAEAVETAAEFIELFTPLNVGHSDSLLVPIGADYRVRFVAVGQAFGRDEEGGIDWSTVRRLQLAVLERMP
jgi:hypothetical protein